jgi:uncharacterized protein YbjT (DUF2867 family)
MYFLTHGMGAQTFGTGSLLADERSAAEAAFSSARTKGVSHCVFVSGLGCSGHAPSVHLRARFAVEEALRASGLIYTILRAGLLLGAGSVGFMALARTLRKQLVVFLPPWEKLPMQPFALADAIDVLERTLSEDRFKDRTIELGTQDIPSYGQLARRVARLLGLRRLFVPIPFQAKTVMARFLARGARIPAEMAKALVDTMVEGQAVVSDHGAAMRALDIPTRSAHEALEMATREISSSVL